MSYTPNNSIRNILLLLIFIAFSYVGYMIFTKDYDESAQLQQAKRELADSTKKLDSLRQVNEIIFAEGEKLQAILAFKIDSLSAKISKQSQSTKNEKFQLHNATNDENAMYFYDYILKYNRSITE